MKKDLPKRFNWLTVLTKLSEGQEITSNRCRDLSNMAGRWPTCACGQLCDLLPRNHEGCPNDSRLRHLGVKFSEYVESKKWCLALDTFKQIENRTIDLLEEVNPSLVRR